DNLTPAPDLYGPGYSDAGAVLGSAATATRDDAGRAATVVKAFRDAVGGALAGDATFDPAGIRVLDAVVDDFRFTVVTDPPFEFASPAQLLGTARDLAAAHWDLAAAAEQQAQATRAVSTKPGRSSMRRFFTSRGAHATQAGPVRPAEPKARTVQVDFRAAAGSMHRFLAQLDGLGAPPRTTRD